MEECKYYEDKQIKEDEIGGACTRHWTDGKFIQNFNRKTSREGAAWKA
jgi:hypothetical protein